MTNVEKLQEYKDQSYVFHGSYRADLEILEPRTAKDDVDDSNDFNNDTAVFASKYPEASVALACINDKVAFRKGLVGPIR